MPAYTSATAALASFFAPMKALLCIAAVLALWTGQAWSAPCPPPQITVGWSQSFYTATTLKGFTFNQQTSVLYVILPSNQYVAYFNVPAGTAQAFTTTSQPDQFYANNVANAYHASLETEVCGLLQTESLGYLWTH